MVTNKAIKLETTRKLINVQVFSMYCTHLSTATSLSELQAFVCDVSASRTLVCRTDSKQGVSGRHSVQKSAEVDPAASPV